MGDLYLPPPSAPPRQQAAIVVGHPGTGIKEQASGLYARNLAKHAFIALAFDAAYQGESGGEPRYLEDPAQRVEDFRAAVTFLSTLKEVDSERIGMAGICASGAYGISAAQTDVRMRAVAAVYCVCWGGITLQSMKDSDGKINPEALQRTLVQAANERTAEAKGEKPATFSILDVFEGAKEYYKTPRGEHPMCSNLQLVRSAELLIPFDSFWYIE